MQVTKFGFWDSGKWIPGGTPAETLSQRCRGAVAENGWLVDGEAVAVPEEKPVAVPNPELITDTAPDPVPVSEPDPVPVSEPDPVPKPAPRKRKR